MKLLRLACLCLILMASDCETLPPPPTTPPLIKVQLIVSPSMEAYARIFTPEGEIVSPTMTIKAEAGAAASASKIEYNLTKGMVDLIATGKVSLYFGKDKSFSFVPKAGLSQLPEDIVTADSNGMVMLALIETTDEEAHAKMNGSSGSFIAMDLKVHFDTGATWKSLKSSYSVDKVTALLILKGYMSVKVDKDGGIVIEPIL